jgi:hypothetical protein
MATFTYRCPNRGCPAAPGDADRRFDVRFPIGTAPPVTPCLACGTDARRVFSTPRLSLAPRHLTAAIDRAERSRTDPAVVGALPSANGGRPRRAAPANPALRRLPRP